MLGKVDVELMVLVEVILVVVIVLMHVEEERGFEVLVV